MTLLDPRLFASFTAVALLATATACRREPSADTGPVTKEQVNSIANAPIPAKLTAQEGRQYMAHMIVTVAQTPTHSDSIKAAAIVDSVRQAISPFKDVSVARAQGYEEYPGKEGREHHFSKHKYSGDTTRLDIPNPTSLLYTKDSAGNYSLIGAMYDVPGTFTESALNSLIPLSIGRWHKHANWCFPPANRQDLWGERDDGNLVFGSFGVDTREDCDKFHGIFKTDIGGWAIHVLPFEKDPYGGDQMGAMMAGKR